MVMAFVLSWAIMDEIDNGKVCPFVPRERERKEDSLIPFECKLPHGHRHIVLIHNNIRTGRR